MLPNGECIHGSTTRPPGLAWRRGAGASRRESRSGLGLSASTCGAGSKGISEGIGVVVGTSAPIGIDDGIPSVEGAVGPRAYEDEVFFGQFALSTLEQGSTSWLGATHDAPNASEAFNCPFLYAPPGGNQPRTERLLGEM